MVDLPTVNDSAAQVRAPTPMVSPGQIAQPYSELAGTLDKAAGVTMRDFAEPFAEKAGLQAVTRDDQGNLQVQHSPIFGDAAAVFQRAVKFSALAQGEGEAKRQDLLLSKQFHNDPQSYQVAADEYRKSMVDQYTKAAGPEVGVALGRSIDSATTYNYRYLLSEQQRDIKANFDKDTNAAIASKQNDLLNLIATGGANTPDARRLISDVITLHNERVSNPVLAAPAGVAKIQLEQFDHEVGAAKFVYGINETLKDPDGGPAAARDAVDAVMKDESLSPTQRVINHLHGLAAIKDYAQDNERNANLAAKQQKQKDDMLESAIIKDSASGAPQITENDIKTNPDMSPASKMRMLSWQKRDGMPEPLTQASQATTMDLFRRMNLPDGDPQKITTLGPIRDAYAPANGGRGSLKREDEEWLEKRFLEARTPDGDRLNQIRTQFSKAVEPSIDKSNPLLGKIDQDGKLQTYRFERFVDQKVDEYRKAGKNPYDLFDPGKPDYMGKPETVQQFKIPIQQSIRNISNNLTGGSVAPGPAVQTQTQSFTPPATGGAAPQRQKGETPADYLKRNGAQ